MNALSVRGLTKTYRNGVQALRGVDLEVERGDFFALLGPNGAGKTTLIGIITSLVNKSRGEARVFGHSIDTDLEEAKACIGVVPQEINFNMWESPFTILVNQAGFYGIARPVARARAEQYLKQLQLWDKRKGMSRALSGGMKRRLMIARALMHEPRLLILDEPTAGVDIEIRRSMWDFLREINARGTTIILTTHYLEEAETLCRNIAIINDGRIIERDRMSSLLRRLHVQTIVLSVRNPLATAPLLPGYLTTLLDEHTLEVEVSRDENLNDIFTRLSSLAIDVLSMRNKVNRLEEIFIRLVEGHADARAQERGAGHGISEGAADPAAGEATRAGGATPARERSEEAS
jgi:ABC-2 type transport system ATP-binding protein